MEAVTESDQKRFKYWKLLSYATGYSTTYVYKVVTGRRSQTSKGGKIIMKKYEEFKEFINIDQ